MEIEKIEIDKKSLGIGAVFKNETHIMIEWIEHYLSHGIDNIYLINDNSKDNVSAIKEMYDNDTRIKFYDSDVDSGPYKRQIDIYNKYLGQEIKKYDWFGILDLDEFLYSPKYPNLKDALMQIPEDINQVLVNWVTFGSNGFYKQPLSVVESFDKRIANIANPNFLSHKNLFRPKFLNSLDIHIHSVLGKTDNFSYLKNPEDPLFLLNHYVIQSNQFFNSVKAVRGDVNKIVGTNFRDMSYFNKFDHNDILDNRLFLQNKNNIKDITNKIYEFHSKNVSFSQCFH